VAYHGEPGPLIAGDAVLEANLGAWKPLCFGEHATQAVREGRVHGRRSRSIQPVSWTAREPPGGGRPMDRSGIPGARARRGVLHRRLVAASSAYHDYLTRRHCTGSRLSSGRLPRTLLRTYRASERLGSAWEMAMLKWTKRASQTTWSRKREPRLDRGMSAQVPATSRSRSGSGNRSEIRRDFDGGNDDCSGRGEVERVVRGTRAVGRCSLQEREPRDKDGGPDKHMQDTHTNGISN
jgi:hypothetical protein